MKIKKLFVVEIILIVVFLSVATIFVVLNPLLESSKRNTAIGLFNHLSFPIEKATIQQGFETYADFNYSSFEPAIIRVDLVAIECQKQGYLTLYCNGRFIANAYLSPKSVANIAGVSLAGVDLAKSQDYNSILFTSDSPDGFEGTFAYQIKLRGSR